MFRVLRLNACAIYDQLLLEERLLRSSTDNWCLINWGSPPAIVMGISGKQEELVDSERAATYGIPLIRRFSGGGTVLVDEDTLFVTFISQKEIHDFLAYPEPIMKWTEEIYQDALCHPDFRLRENDYVLADRKFGGNAQYIRKDRWLHHTSFLWDYCPKKMQCLLHPKKTPPYRAGRSHDEFLCKLSQTFETREEVVGKVVRALGKRFAVIETSLEEALSLSAVPSRLSTQIIPHRAS